MVIVLHKPTGVICKVLDVVESGGIKYACLEALDGSKPFADGAKTTTRTNFYTSPKSNLELIGIVDPAQAETPVVRA